MFDQILQMVKDHIGGNPQVTSNIPSEQADEVHQEIATHINNGLKNEAVNQGGSGGLLSMLENGVSSGSSVVNAIEGGLASTLGSKFGLPPAATGAISAMLPGLLQKFAHKANDPNDSSITPESINQGLSTNNAGGGIGSFLSNL